ncbi:uncharacterized protein LOC118739971 [Rhagoletis pomonella]|uniref:uncharacterized protein LOC118739971 n=1 Tax=Rhagoletis pomonella TaxID=28610 RepID=UPI0017858A1E|nr:uncharacterized protein LOC118739971 [Rhagoletis pomonella]
MLTACKDELPNAHRNCIHEILNALVCHDNDLRRINIELRELQYEYKNEMNKLHFGPTKRNKAECKGSEEIVNFTRKITTIHDLNQCFSKKSEALKKNREEIINAARQCILALNSEKCKFKQFHEKTVDYLKRYAIKSDDPTVIQNCEKDICEMHKLFVKEVAFIKKCETDLESFFQLCNLQDMDVCCCFKDYDWIPTGKTLDVVDDLANEIKCLMGTTISKAFAQFHIRQAPDIKSFLAAYLMNLEHNEEVLREKLNIFSSLT